MSSGGYIGGHTQIFLAEDGTIWPKGIEGGQAFSKRWANDAVWSDINQNSHKSDHKRHEFRILAAYASALHTKTRPPAIRNVPVTLLDNIRSAGGVIEWINQDDTRLSRFWRFVEQLGEQDLSTE